MQIPSTVDEVTTGWLSEVLAEDVTSVEVIEAHSGTTGRAKIRITSPADVPETLFVKLQPFDDDQRSFLRVIGLGVAEAKLYAAVGAELPVRVPKVWHSAYDDADGSFIMLLEDLDAAGCRFPSPDDPDALAVAESLVDELAVLHAAYWEHDLPWLGAHALSPGDSPEAQERMAMGASIIASALDQFVDDFPAEFRRLGETYISASREIGALFNEGERTLIHGDDHIGNLFVERGRTGFYDWAVASRYPGMRDVAYFLCNSLPTDVRRAEQDALLSRYRAGLEAGGVALDARNAKDQYRLFSIYSWVSATSTAAMGSKWQPIEIGWQATKRTTQAIIDLDVLGFLAERGLVPLMAERQIRTIVHDVVFGEAPRWHDHRLWFSDMHGETVYAVDLDGRLETIVSMEGRRPSGLGFLPDGSLLVVSMLEREVLRWDGDTLQLHADLSPLVDHGCNDMVVDQLGRAYVGCFPPVSEPDGPLIVVETDGSARVAAHGLTFPNGAVITPDGTTLIIAESLGRRLTAFDIDETGELSGRRVFADLPSRGPDGICLDAEGAVWAAMPLAHVFERIGPGGEVLDAIDCGDRMAIACALGGEDGNVLFLLTAEDHNPAALAGTRNGWVQTVEVSVGTA